MTTYNDYFEVDPGYKPVMTAEEINKEPETWLNFYPHNTFVKILQTLLEKLEHSNKSVWVHGAYGTGKSHAALVIHKLFFDEESRVEKWFTKRKGILPQEVIGGIRKWRKKRVFPIFEYGTEGINSTDRFLVRIERAIAKACKGQSYKIPARGSSEILLARIEEEGTRFFNTRNEIQSQLEHLTPDIKNFEDFKKHVANPKFSDGLYQDARAVLEKRSIFLELDAEGLLDWINDIRQANGLAKIIFLWDEFTTYIDVNRNDLKAFEKMAEEKAQLSGFHFIPITHTHIAAYVAEGSESAKKANDRYSFCPLEIPPNTVFALGHDALKIKKGKDDEWQRELEKLAIGIAPVVTNYMESRIPDVKFDDFKGVLPIHPMSAFLLIYLAQNIGSNVRSFFDYLKDSSGQSEFQAFISKGGPEVDNHQYLTVDYLWHYFVERSDLGTSKDVFEIRAQFDSKTRACRLSEIEQRVFKAVLLYHLMSTALGHQGHDLLMPTVENIVRAFEGDGAVVGVEGILNELCNKHCFAIVGKRCEIFQTGSSIEIAPEMDKLRTEFTRFIASPTADRIDNKIKEYGDKLRYVVKGYNGIDFKHSDIKNKPDYGEGQPAKGNKVLVNFLFARNQQEQLEIPEKAKSFAKHYTGLRMLFITLPDLTFCDDAKNNWENFIEQQSRFNLATDGAMRSVYEEQLKKIFNIWDAKVKEPLRKLRIYIANVTANTEPHEIEGTWTTLKNELQKQLKVWFQYGVDEYSGYFGSAYKVPPNALKAWAKAGITAPEVTGTYQGLVRSFRDNNIGFTPQWFEDNQTHPLSQMREFAMNKLRSSTGRGSNCSIRLLYTDLRRAPYGLQQVGYSAFVLGFVLKEWLDADRKLQWTNGQITKPLDSEILSDIIDTVIQNDDNGVIREEKEICRLSKEDKAFSKGITNIFGLVADPNAAPENTLTMLAAKVPQISGNVPLWVLPSYIRNLGTEPAEDIICAVVTDLCDALKASSRNAANRAEKIKVIGSAFERTEGLVETLKKYLKPDIFMQAFKHYIDLQNPELYKLAETIGDQWNGYCDTIKGLFAQEAGWLWNETDVSSTVVDVKAQYGVICTVQRLCKISTFISFADAKERLSKAMIEQNKIALETLALSHPPIRRLGELVMETKLQGEAIKEFDSILDQQMDTIQSTFFDPSYAAQIAILKSLFADNLGNMSNSEWKSIYNMMTNGALRTEGDFKQTAWNEIEKHQESSLIRQLLAIWKTKTNSDTPAKWSEKTGLPSEVLFTDTETANDIMRIVTSPGDYQRDSIKEAIQRLEQGVISNCSEAKQKNIFMRRYFPVCYSKLDIESKTFSDALAAKLGNEPNTWKKSPNFNTAIADFIREHYAAEFKQKAIKKIQALSNDEAKSILLKLIEKSPDVGLEILGG